jgi:hypothetical protein
MSKAWYPLLRPDSLMGFMIDTYPGIFLQGMLATSLSHWGGCQCLWGSLWTGRRNSSSALEILMPNFTSLFFHDFWSLFHSWGSRSMAMSVSRLYGYYLSRKG